MDRLGLCGNRRLHRGHLAGVRVHPLQPAGLGDAAEFLDRHRVGLHLGQALHHRCGHGRHRAGRCGRRHVERRHRLDRGRRGGCGGHRFCCRHRFDRHGEVAAAGGSRLGSGFGLYASGRLGRAGIRRGFARSAFTAITAIAVAAAALARGALGVLAVGLGGRLGAGFLGGGFRLLGSCLDQALRCGFCAFAAAAVLVARTALAALALGRFRCG